MDRGAWQATAHGVAKSQTQLSTHTHAQEHVPGSISQALGTLMSCWWGRSWREVSESLKQKTCPLLFCIPSFRTHKSLLLLTLESCRGCSKLLLLRGGALRGQLRVWQKWWLKPQLWRPGTQVLGTEGHESILPLLLSLDVASSVHTGQHPREERKAVWRLTNYMNLAKEKLRGCGRSQVNSF